MAKSKDVVKEIISVRVINKDNIPLEGIDVDSSRLEEHSFEVDSNLTKEYKILILKGMLFDYGRQKDNIVSYVNLNGAWSLLHC